MNNGNELAFPLVGREDYNAGLTKREWFAGLAMQGMLSDPKQAGSSDEIAHYAVYAADALIKELEERDDR